jgi:hypothetical protein
MQMNQCLAPQTQHAAAQAVRLSNTRGAAIADLSHGLLLRLGTVPDMQHCLIHSSCRYLLTAVQHGALHAWCRGNALCVYVACFTSSA